MLPQESLALIFTALPLLCMVDILAVSPTEVVAVVAALLRLLHTLVEMAAEVPLVVVETAVLLHPVLLVVAEAAVLLHLVLPLRPLADPLVNPSMVSTGENIVSTPMNWIASFQKGPTRYRHGCSIVQRLGASQITRCISRFSWWDEMVSYETSHTPNDLAPTLET